MGTQFATEIHRATAEAFCQKDECGLLEEFGLKLNLIVLRFRSIMSRPPIIDRTQSCTFDRPS